MTPSREIDLLILGAGWTSTFLIPLLQDERISFAATSTTGRDGTIKFIFDPDSNDPEPYNRLPKAQTILVTFPLKGRGQSTQIHELYRKTHAAMVSNWIQLGSTGIYTESQWTDRSSPYEKDNARALAEDELIYMGGVVLNLAGLWGGSRDPRNWVTRVAKSRAELKTKKALHLIHGEDVARAIVAVHRRFSPGERWIVTDLCVYDWYDLVYKWADWVQRKNPERDLPYREWVMQLMRDEEVRALPRSPEVLGRCLDSREFWIEMRVLPERSLFR